MGFETRSLIFESRLAVTTKLNKLAGMLVNWSEMLLEWENLPRIGKRADKNWGKKFRFLVQISFYVSARTLWEFFRKNLCVDKIMRTLSGKFFWKNFRITQPELASHGRKSLHNEGIFFCNFIRQKLKRTRFLVITEENSKPFGIFFSFSSAGSAV